IAVVRCSPREDYVFSYATAGDDGIDRVAGETRVYPTGSAREVELQGIATARPPVVGSGRGFGDVWSRGCGGRGGSDRAGRGGRLLWRGRIEHGRRERRFERGRVVAAVRLEPGTVFEG